MNAEGEQTMDGGPERAIRWLALACPGCRARLCLKEAFAHLRGRCPECGARIEAPRPRPFAPAPPTIADNELDFEAIDEEWPESARLEEDMQGAANYGMTASPDVWSEPERKEPPPPIDGYDLSDGWKPGPSVAPLPLPESYDVGSPDSVLAPAEAPILYRLSRAELTPLREPKLTRPLLEGIYDFPWHGVANISIWLFLAAGWFIVTAFAMLAVAVWASSIMGLVLIGLGPSLLITGAFSASYFLAVVKDTAAGNRHVEWPDDHIMDRIFQMLYLSWIAMCAVGPAWLLAMVTPDLFVTPAAAVSLGLIPLALFPVFLLSALASPSWWGLINWRVWARMVRRMPAVGAVYLASVVIIAPCVWLGIHIVVHFEYRLTPVTALAWSAALMIYGRLLGRLGWVLARPDLPKKKRN